MQNSRKQNGKNQAETANNIYPIKQGSPVESNYTKVPNWLFDTGFEAVEQAVLMSIVRYTLGYHRKSAKISHAALCKHAHCAKPRLIKAISKLESEGCIQVFRSTENGAKLANSYSIINKTDEYINPDVVTADYYPSNVGLLPLVTADYYPSNVGLHNKENLKESNKENSKEDNTPYSPPNEKASDEPKNNSAQSHDFAESVNSAFESVWQSMPLRKVSKEPARKAWNKIFLSRKKPNPEKLANGVTTITEDLQEKARHLTAENGVYDNPFWKLHFATYLNQQRWTDEELPARGKIIKGGNV